MDLLVEHDLDELAQVYYKLLDSSWGRTIYGLLTLADSEGVEFEPDNVRDNTDSDDESWKDGYDDDS